MDQPPKITGTRYVLAVKDLVVSADYYQRELGFSSLWAGEGWHFLAREKFVVMLGECPDDRSAFETRNHSYFAYVDVENIDALYDEYSKKNITMRKVENKPWGMREFVITTVDGHRITFGQRIDTL